MNPATVSGPAIGPVPIEFILFGLVLAGVALFHAHTLRIALGGAIVIAVYKIVFSPFKTGAGLPGFGSHLLHEWVILINLLLLLLGFALLAKHFEDTEVPAVLPRWLPDDWTGCFVLLALVFVLSRTRCSGARCTSATWPPSSRRRMQGARAAWWATPRRR
jgi:hypothetical protein